MLIAEYDYDVDIAVQREEEREIVVYRGLSTMMMSALDNS